MQTGRPSEWQLGVWNTDWNAPKTRAEGEEKKENQSDSLLNPLRPSPSTTKSCVVVKQMLPDWPLVWGQQGLAMKKKENSWRGRLFAQHTGSHGSSKVQEEALCSHSTKKRNETQRKKKGGLNEFLECAKCKSHLDLYLPGPIITVGKHGSSWNSSQWREMWCSGKGKLITFCWAESVLFASWCFPRQVGKAFCWSVVCN